MDQFLKGYASSSYSFSLQEYLAPTLDGIADEVQYDGYIIDSQVQLEYESPGNVVGVLGQMADQGLIQIRNDGSSYFLVLSAHRRLWNEPCGWHGFIHSQSFSYAIAYDLDNDSECAVGDSLTGHTEGLAAIANVTARALAEARTDAYFAGWLDATGNEVDDLCAWTFSVPYVTFPDGSKWKLQDLWSNKAYEAGTGHPNASGQRGCVTGR